MGEFVGNPNENLCVTAARGRWFVPRNERGGKTIAFTRNKTILASVSIAVILALLLGIIYLLGPQRIILPKYNKLCGMLGDSKEDVLNRIPEEVKYADTTFKVVPYYENDVLHGFAYTATIDDPEAAVETMAEILKKMHRVMGENYEKAPSLAELKKTLNSGFEPHWRLDATEHSPGSVEKYMEKLGYANPSFISLVRIEKQDSGTSITMSFKIVDDIL